MYSLGYHHGRFCLGPRVRYIPTYVGSQCEENQGMEMIRDQFLVEPVNSRLGTKLRNDDGMPVHKNYLCWI